MKSNGIKHYSITALGLWLYLVFCLSIMRVGWFISFSGDDHNLADILQAFFTGFRFDIAAGAYCALLPYLFIPLIFLLKDSYRSKIFFFITYIFSLLAIVINSFDIGFYSFFQDHLNLLFFGFFEDDTTAILKTIWKNYPVVLYSILIVLALGVHFYLFKRIYIKMKRFKFKNNKMRAVSFASGFFILMLAGRGNLNTKPLSYQEAQFTNDTFVNQIALNGIFALYRAVKVREKLNNKDFDLVESVGFKGREAEAFSIVLGQEVESSEMGLKLLRKRTRKSTFLEKSPPNVIVILCESFGSYWLKYQSEKFNILGALEPHLKSDLLFKNFTSAENGTIGSLISLFLGQVSRPGSVVVSESRYAYQQVSSAMHKPFMSKGYNTYFGYGGKLGWRDLGAYIKRQGMGEIFGQKTISNMIKTEDLGNEWGVYDEHFFQATYQKVTTSKKPFFFFGMTTSNHPPYDVPENYSPYPLEMPAEMKDRLMQTEDYTLKRFKAFQYSNDQLGKFISKIKASPKGDNTIIVFTGDHNFWDIFRFNENENFTKYTVPLYIYIPEKYKKRDYPKQLNNFASMHDIMPTIYSLALSDAQYVSFGNSVLDKDSFASNGSSLVASKEGVAISDRFYEWQDREGGLLKRSEIKLTSLLDRYKALIAVTEIFLRSEKK